MYGILKRRETDTGFGLYLLEITNQDQKEETRQDSTCDRKNKQFKGSIGLVL